VARARRAKLGNGLNSGTELGPLASYLQLRHVTELVDDARREGGRVLCGGGATAGPPGDEGPGTGLFYLPTIVVGIREGTRLVDEEQFGPVVPVMPFKDVNEAVRRANGTCYGLGASVWSRDVAKANSLADQLRAGTVWVNAHCEFIRNAPFGGIGSSGIGRAGDLGLRDLAEYTELRTMCLAVPPVPTVKAVARAIPCISVQAKAQGMLGQRLASIRTDLHQDPDTFAAEAKEAVRTFPLQPVDFRPALLSILEADGPPCVMFSGMPTEQHLDTSVAGRSQSSSSRSGLGHSNGEALLMGVAALLGACAVGYKGHRNEAFVRELPADAHAGCGWHRGGRCSPAYEAPRRFYRPEELVPDLVAAFCIRSDSSTSLQLVDLQRLCDVIAVEDLNCLRCHPLTFFDNETGVRSEQVLVAADSADQASAVPILDLREPSRFEAEGIPEAVAAYERVLQAAEANSESLKLRSGDLIILNNKRCLHAWGRPEPDEQALLQTLHARRCNGGSVQVVQ